MNSPRRLNLSKRAKLLGVVLIAIAAFVLFDTYNTKRRMLGNTPITAAISLRGASDITKSAPLATWPWPATQEETSHQGVTRYESTSDDGTIAILMDFDFKTNPQLRFEIYDQDAHDSTPFDNRVHYWKRGVGGATKEINAEGRGEVIAAWNGLFFGYANAQMEDESIGFHLSPVTLNGKVYFNTANHRWGFGVKYTEKGPQWKIAHLPSRKWFSTLDWGGGSAQCLIKDGKPLKLQPFPAPGDAPLPQPVKSTPEEVGHIPIFDHMKTCRASLAWSRDDRHLYLLFIKELDSEGASILAFKHRQSLQGGWTVPDLQRFWLAFQKQRGTLTAINSDAGDVAQLTFLRSDGRYDLLPPRQDYTHPKRTTYMPEFKEAPAGGAIMYFYVRDSR